MLNRVMMWWPRWWNPWRFAVIEAAVVNGTYTHRDETDPEGAIRKLLAHVAQVAESPEGNPKIRALVERIEEFEANELTREMIIEKWQYLTSRETSSTEQDLDDFHAFVLGYFPAREASTNG